MCMRYVRHGGSFHVACILCYVTAAYINCKVARHSFLYNVGVRVTTSSGTTVCKAMLLMVSVDLPARAMVLDMKQFNGKNGCCYCESPGTPRPSLPMIRNWPPGGGHPLRTHESIRENGKRALDLGNTVSEYFMFWCFYAVSGSMIMCVGYWNQWCFSIVFA